LVKALKDMTHIVVVNAATGISQRGKLKICQNG
jgi:hypothetical protein